MITILIQKILDMLSGHFPAVITLLSKLNLIEEDTEEIRGNVDSMKTTLEDVDTQATAAAAKLNTINTTVTSIDSNTAAIKTNSDAIKNNILSMSSNVGNIAAYSEDTANNTLDIDQKITSIASDTTDIRTATNDIYDENAKIYDAVKWLLADKEIEETERGDNSVTFDTDMTEDLTGLTVGLVATQSGTGEPSPDNSRPIDGYSNIGLTINGNAVSISLGDTYYMGVADLINGNLTFNAKVVLIDGTQNVTVVNTNYIKSDACDGYVNVSDIFPNVNVAQQQFNFKSDKLKYAKANIWQQTGYADYFAINFNQVHVNISNDRLGITDWESETTATVKTKITNFLTNNNISVLYGIEPVVISLTPQQIATIKGVNTITTDTNGEIVVTYKESIKHYLDKQEN